MSAAFTVLQLSKRFRVRTRLIRRAIQQRYAFGRTQTSGTIPELSGRFHLPIDTVKTSLRLLERLNLARREFLQGQPHDLWHIAEPWEIVSVPTVPRTAVAKPHLRSWRNPTTLPELIRDLRYCRSRVSAGLAFLEMVGLARPVGKAPTGKRGQPPTIWEILEWDADPIIGTPYEIVNRTGFNVRRIHGALATLARMGIAHRVDRSGLAIVWRIGDERKASA